MNNETNPEENVRSDNSANAVSEIMTQACANFHAELFNEWDNHAGASSSHSNENAPSAHKPEKAEEQQTLHNLFQNNPELSNVIGQELSQWFTEQGMKTSGKLSEQVEQALNNLKPIDSPEGIHLKRDGVDKLGTGDVLIRNNGTEVLVTPKGDTITVKPDGTHEIKGNVQSLTTDKDGTTTVTFADGAKVSLDKSGINNVARGNKSVSLVDFDSINIRGLADKEIYRKQ